LIRWLTADGVSAAARRSVKAAELAHRGERL
jgi:hypothetical protein